MQELSFTNDRYGIEQTTVLCTNCGLIFSSPRLDEESTNKFHASDHYRRLYDDNEFLESYTNKYEEAENYFYRPVDLAKYTVFSFLDFVQETKIEYHSVCEIGAAGGANLIPFLKAGKEAVGYEWSKALVSEGKKRGIPLLQGSIEQIDGTYDLCILNACIRAFFRSPTVH